MHTLRLKLSKSPIDGNLPRAHKVPALPQPSLQLPPKKRKPKMNTSDSPNINDGTKLHLDELKNFFNLTMALKCWLSHTITKEQIAMGKEHML
jgi:hypothetical protein